MSRRHVGERRGSMINRGKRKHGRLKVSFCEMRSVTHFTQTTAREKKKYMNEKSSKMRVRAQRKRPLYQVITVSFFCGFYHQKAN